MEGRIPKKLYQRSLSTTICHGEGLHLHWIISLSYFNAIFSFTIHQKYVKIMTHEAVKYILDD